MITDAFAQSTSAAPGGGDGMMAQFLIIGLMFVLMYFFMIRPQVKKAKEHKLMTEALQKGDEVVALGGILGKITKVGDAYVTLEIAPNTEITVQRAAIGNLLPKGTIKSI